MAEGGSVMPAKRQGKRRRDGAELLWLLGRVPREDYPAIEALMKALKSGDRRLVDQIEAEITARHTETAV